MNLKEYAEYKVTGDVTKVMNRWEDRVLDDLIAIMGTDDIYEFAKSILNKDTLTDDEQVKLDEIRNHYWGPILKIDEIKDPRTWISLLLISRKFQKNIETNENSICVPFMHFRTYRAALSHYLINGDKTKYQEYEKIVDKLFSDKWANYLVEELKSEEII